MKTSLQGSLKAMLLTCLLLSVLACDHTELPPQKQPGDQNSKVVEQKSESAVVYMDRGLAHMAKGQSGLARDNFTKAINLDPNLAEAYCYRAINDIESGAPYWGGTTWDKVIADCNKAIELKPNFAKAYNARGFAYYKRGQNGEAIADYTKAIAFDPDNADAYYHRGLLFYEQKQWDSALIDFSRSIELDPNAIQCQYYRGAIYYTRGEWDKAISDLSKVVARASIAWPEPRQELAKAYYQRGMDFIRKGERDKAIADMNQVIELSKDANLKTLAQQQLKVLGGK